MKRRRILRTARAKQCSVNQSNANSAEVLSRLQLLEGTDDSIEIEHYHENKACCENENSAGEFVGNNDTQSKENCKIDEELDLIYGEVNVASCVLLTDDIACEIACECCNRSTHDTEQPYKHNIENKVCYRCNKTCPE